MKKLPRYKRQMARAIKSGKLEPKVEKWLRKCLRTPEQPNEDLDRSKEYYTYKEIMRSRFHDMLVIYTKSNPKMNESVESANYREIWGTLLPGGRMLIRIFSVIRDGHLTDRCIVDNTNGVRIINLRKTDKLIVTGMRRYEND